MQPVSLVPCKRTQFNLKETTLILISMLKFTTDLNQLTINNQNRTWSQSSILDNNRKYKLRWSATKQSTTPSWEGIYSWEKRERDERWKCSKWTLTKVYILLPQTRIQQYTLGPSTSQDFTKTFSRNLLTTWKIEMTR